MAVSFRLPRSLRRGLLIGAAVLVFVWIAFFDSHSLLRRIQWHHEYTQLSEENAALQERINDLEQRLDQPLPDEAIEKIAREQYGMKRPDETVYRLESALRDGAEAY